MPWRNLAKLPELNKIALSEKPAEGPKKIWAPDAKALASIGISNFVLHAEGGVARAYFTLSGQTRSGINLITHYGFIATPKQPTAAETTIPHLRPGAKLSSEESSLLAGLIGNKKIAAKAPKSPKPGLQVIKIPQAGAIERFLDGERPIVRTAALHVLNAVDASSSPQLGAAVATLKAALKK